MIHMPNTVQMDDLVPAMERLLKASARMYMYLSKATIETFGREGEMTVRLGLRAYGYWRGMEMRQAHHALGLEINMKNLIGCWDNASTYIEKDTMDAGGKFEPYDTRFDIKFCPAAEAWKDDEFYQWGHVYCDEFHQACASAYHPDGNVVIPQNMMKGDDHCHFQWIMPPGAEELDLGEATELGTRLAGDYTAASELEAAWLSLKRSNRLVAGRFVAIARTILERHPGHGQNVIRKGLRDWGTSRGEKLRAEHEAKGLRLSLRNFVEHHDFPVRQVWQPRIVKDSTKAYVIEFDETPNEEAWGDLEAMDLGAAWYEEAYPAMAEAYLPGLAATWQALQARGEEVNRLELNVAKPLH